MLGLESASKAEPNRCGRCTWYCLHAVLMASSGSAWLRISLRINGCSVSASVTSTGQSRRLSLGVGAINPQVGRIRAACDRKHFRSGVMQALADRGIGCAAHKPNPICSVWVVSVSPGWLLLGGRPRRLPVDAAPEAPAALLALAACFAPLLCSPRFTSSS